MALDFSKTTELLKQHNKGILKRKSDFVFSWNDSIEKNIDVIRRGFLYCDRDIKEVEITEEIKQIAEWMINTNGKGLSMIGSSGRGKTLFLHGVLPHLLMALGKAPTSIKAIDIENKCRSNIILIDEVGREDMVFDKEKGKIDRFPNYVDYCADHGLPLFFTSNLKREEFITRYGIHIYNRSKAITKSITCNGKSMWY